MEDEEKWIRKLFKKPKCKEADLLIRSYYDEIYRYVYRQIGNKETAMDITQEIFISMLKSIKTYDSSKSAFRTWLYKIATNKIIDHKRKKVIDTTPLEELKVSTLNDFTKDIELNELVKKIQAKINTMELQIQQIFRLHIYGEYTFGEIGVMLGQKEATVKTKYHRLIKQLREEYLDEK